MAPSAPKKPRKTSKQVNEQIHLNLKPDTKLQITIETGSLKRGKMPVTIHVEPLSPATSSPESKPAAQPEADRRTTFESLKGRLQKYNPAGWLRQFDGQTGRYDPAVWLFILALGIYLITRLIGLTHFPIYFFTDEAIQTQSISDLIANHYRDTNGVFLPPYFRNGEYANLSLSVYLQWIPMLLFGKSALVTRATSVLITLIAAFSVGIILRDIFKSRYWWAGTLFLSITPAWFLHSRTAFETAEFTAFYSGTLCAYLFYRYKSPRYLYLVILLATLAFYSYNPGQLIVPLTTLALLVSDWRYHWENRKTALIGLAMLAVLVIPYIRYRLEYPGAAFSHLHTMFSYMVEDIPTSEKITRYITEYGRGLSPSYWYVSNNRDLSRHLMKNYGHILLATLPFAILGLGRVLSHLREPANRVLLISFLVCPASAALVDTSITRVLIFVVPAAILTTLGLEMVLNWLQDPLKAASNSLQGERPQRTLRQTLLAMIVLALMGLAAILAQNLVDRLAILALAVILGIRIFGLPRLTETRKERKLWVIPQAVFSLLLFLTLAGTNFFMLYDALKNGPIWFSDYGMGGMQYGAFQLFPLIKEYKQEHPDTNIIFSPNWANGTNIVARFFLDDPLPFEIASVEGHITQKLPLDDHTLFIMTPDEFKLVSANSKFKDVHVEKIISYPDDTPGFYFVRMHYVDNIDEIFAAEKALRDIPRESTITVDGQEVHVKHSYLDAGEEDWAQHDAIEKLFDNDPLSLAKTFEANPFVIELAFPGPRTLNGFSIIIGSAKAHITIKCYATPDAQPVIYTFDGQGSMAQPELSFDLPRPTEFQILQVEMLDPLSTPPTKVHIWELTLR